MQFRNFALLAPLSILVSCTSALPESRRDSVSVEIAEIEALLASAVAVTCDVCQEVLDKTQDFLKAYSAESYAGPLFTLRDAVSLLLFSLQEVHETKKLYCRSVRPVKAAPLQRERRRCPGAPDSTNPQRVFSSRSSWAPLRR